MKPILSGWEQDLKESPESDHFAIAHAGDHEAFTILVEPYRRELTAHCYRILGSIQDAEDLVQGTMLRAWRHLDSYEGRGTLRAWLYKIATHACFDAIAKRPKRTLPPARYPAADPQQPYEAPRS